MNFISLVECQNQKSKSDVNGLVCWVDLFLKWMHLQ
jgi:hypothetical protein